MEINVEGGNAVVQSQLGVLKALAPAVFKDELSHVAVIAMNKNGGTVSHFSLSPSNISSEVPRELLEVYSQLEMTLVLINAVEELLEKNGGSLERVEDDVLYIQQKLLSLADSLSTKLRKE